MRKGDAEEDGGEEKFVWVKRQKLIEQKGLRPEEIERREAERRERNRREIAKLEAQRLAREAEREAKQQERDGGRMMEAGLGDDWQEKERKFHREQALARAEARIEKSRGTPFDWLILNTRVAGEGPKYCFIDDPLLILSEVMANGNVEGLVKELEEQVELERDEASLDYLHALISFMVVEEESAGVKALKAVAEDVKSMFKGKAVHDLNRLESSIKQRIASNPAIDTEYWEGVLGELVRFRRRALISETTQILSERHDLEGCIRLTMEDWERQKLGETPVIHTSYESKLIVPTPSPPSPALMDCWDPSPQSKVMYESEEQRKVHKDELPFNTEADDLEPCEPVWMSTNPGINPVKPRYFNRVRTSYEWNKYNQTHYDLDNPPPKTVQGYRFNIFYPLLGLQDSSNNGSPTYKLESDPSNPAMRIIRFTAGPPYQDLCFRITHDEWDMSHRQGFKCIFESGCLRLHFWFKSQRYKR